MQQLATVLYELKDRGDDQGVVDVFEAGIGLGSEKSAVLKEFYAVSLNKVGRLEDSITALKSLSSDKRARIGEVSAILGKVFKLKSEAATIGEEKKELMGQSVEALRRGFYSTYEYYPGINLVYNQIELANLTDNPDLIDQAFSDAELVMYAARKAGAEYTSDFWAVATLLEASVFSGKVSPEVIQHCIDVSKNDWELEATINNLDRVSRTISDYLSSEQLNPASRQRLSEVKDIIDGDDGVLAKLSRKVKSPDVVSDNARDIRVEGFSYGETTTLVGGNIKYGGQLQDHVVNRFDVEVAYALMRHFNIEGITDIDEFSGATDSIIRNQFGTGGLEDLRSEEHAVYDVQIKNLLESLGIGDGVDKSTLDSRTNVMVDFLLGKGDCRQHAHVKQLLFDCWKTRRMNQLIDKLRLSAQNSAEQDKAREEIDGLLSRQMMVFDSTVEAKIKMNGLYNPETSDDGRLLVSENFEPVEDHTWNGIVEVGHDGQVISLKMADSFYQNIYGFGGRDQIIENPDSYVEEEGMVVTTIVAIDNNGQEQRVLVRLKPTVYAGDRGERALEHDDVGAACLRGVDLGLDVPEVAGVLSSIKIDELWGRMAA